MYSTHSTLIFTTLIVRFSQQLGHKYCTTKNIDKFLRARDQYWWWVKIFFSASETAFYVGVFSMFLRNKQPIEIGAQFWPPNQLIEKIPT